MTYSYFYSDCDLVVTTDIDKTDITYREISKDAACNLLILMDSYFSWVFWNDTNIKR